MDLTGKVTPSLEFVALDERAAARFVAQVAMLRMDGEGSDDEDDAEPWVMENDDAYDTLHSLIGEARGLLGWQPGRPPLDQPDYQKEGTR
jgi:hypothetical protein